MTMQREHGRRPFGCPDNDVLADVFLGSADLEARLKAVDHVAECAECVEVLAQLSALRDWSPEDDAIVEPVAETRPPLDRRRSLLLAAAALLLAVGSALIWQSSLRSAETPERLRGTSASSSLGQADLSRPLPVVDGVPPSVDPLGVRARGLRLEVYDSASNVLWRSEAPDGVGFRDSNGQAQEWTAVPPEVFAGRQQETYFFCYLWFEGAVLRSTALYPASIHSAVDTTVSAQNKDGR